MSLPIQIHGISGSLRKGSFNTGLLRAAQELAPEDVRLTIYDLSAIPLYNADLEHEGFPDSVQQFKEAIRAADALLFAIPEYNYSIPGVLKNAIDWVSRPPQTSPLSGKPIAMMGAGGRFGTVRAQLHFRQIAVYTNMLPLNKPELMIPLAWEKFDAEGRLSDESDAGVCKWPGGGIGCVTQQIPQGNERKDSMYRRPCPSIWAGSSF